MPTPTPSRDIRVRVRLPERPDDGVVQWVAAAPADYRSSFSGSGLPFVDAKMAFYNTPNHGTASVEPDRTVAVDLYAPNSYYVGLGTVRVPPTLHLVYTVGGRTVRQAVPVGQGIPFRSLTYPGTRENTMFYAPEQPRIRSQEEILRASAYPSTNQEPADFWGARPAR